MVVQAYKTELAEHLNLKGGYEVCWKEKILATAAVVGAKKAVEHHGYGSVRSIRHWQKKKDAGETLENKQPGPVPGTTAVVGPSDLGYIKSLLCLLYTSDAADE
mgnify:CR=1 FL=1